MFTACVVCSLVVSAQCLGNRFCIVFLVKLGLGVTASPIIIAVFYVFILHYKHPSFNLSFSCFLQTPLPQPSAKHSSLLEQYFNQQNTSCVSCQYRTHMHQQVSICVTFSRIVPLPTPPSSLHHHKFFYLPSPHKFPLPSLAPLLTFFTSPSSPPPLSLSSPNIHHIIS